MDAFDAANTYYAFDPVPSPAVGEPWEGTVNRCGRLRLVATGPNVFSAAVFDLGKDVEK